MYIILIIDVHNYMYIYFLAPKYADSFVPGGIYSIQYTCTVHISMVLLISIHEWKYVYHYHICMVFLVNCSSGVHTFDLRCKLSFHVLSSSLSAW